MIKRQAKFYKRHEKVVMKKLGFEPVVGSGAGWVNKEDGESEFFLAQLKSTDKNSFTIKREDLDKLEYHAKVTHKLPVFVNEFLQDGKIYITISLDDIESYVQSYNLSRGSESPSHASNSGGQIFYHNGPEDASECQPGTLEMVQNIGGTCTLKKVVKSGGRERYQKLREKEKEKEYASNKFRRRK